MMLMAVELSKNCREPTEDGHTQKGDIFNERIIQFSFLVFHFHTF